MRRLSVCLVMLQGLILPSTLLAAHGRGATVHASRAAYHRRPISHASVSHGVGSHILATHGRAKTPAEHTKRKPGQGQPAGLENAALIDPVPLGRFPLPPPLKGSHESLVRQNVRSREEGLSRVEDDADLLALRRDKELVSLPATSAPVVDERLPVNRRYCREWTAEFLSDLSRVHYRRFHRALRVNSAVRTVEYQRHLELVNGNAAPAEGDDASPHLTGATIDIAKKGLTMDEIGWMRAYLAPLEAAGKLDVEEEFYQSCFHITVYRSYAPAAPLVEAKSKANPRDAGSAALLAAEDR